MICIRKNWVQLVIVCVALALLNLYALYLPSTTEIRHRSGAALQSILLIFTVTSALTIMIFASYARGVRTSMVELVNALKNRLWTVYDTFSESEDPALRGLIEDHILPLLAESLREYFQPQRFLGRARGIEESIRELQKFDAGKVAHARHFLPILDSLDELGRLYVRSITVSIYANLVARVFQLIACAMIVVGANHLLPDQPITNIVIANASVAAITYAILVLFIAISWVRQEAREEDVAYVCEVDGLDD